MIITALVVSAVTTAGLPPPAQRVLAAAVLVAMGDAYERPATQLVSGVVDELRGPDGQGGYRWARWAPGGGQAVRDGDRIRAVTGTPPQLLRLSAEHASRVTVEVPERRSLFSGNYACVVERVAWRCAAWRKSQVVHDSPRRLPRGEQMTFPLSDVCPALEVEVGATVEPEHKGETRLEVEIETGHLEDDPDSPFFPAVRRLARYLAEGGSRSSRFWADELASVAEQLGGRTPALRYRLERIRALLSGSERDRRRALDELDDLIEALP